MKHHTKSIYPVNNGRLCYIKQDPYKGRCIYTVRMPPSLDILFAPNERILTNPVIVFNAEEQNVTKELSDFQMAWDDVNDCFALGLINLVNHSDDPNCKVVKDYENKTITLVALKNIGYNEELTTKYACEIWFEKK